MNTSVESRLVVEGCLKPRYPSAPNTLLNRLIRTTYRLAYLGHLAVNFVLRPKTRGAYVALWLDGRVLLIRNSYKSEYTLPCGGIERGESAIAAAQRELREEVGLDIPLRDFYLVWHTTNETEFKHDHVYFFEVQLKQPPRLKPDGREVVWVGFHGLKSALAMPVFAPVRDYLLKQLRIAGKRA